jgi:uncharacterized protein (DUF1330 family)
MPAYLIANIEVTDAADYAPLLQLRKDSTVSDVVIVEGYSPPA